MMRLSASRFSTFKSKKTELNYTHLLAQTALKTHHHGIQSLALSPHGKLAVIGKNLDKTISIWDLQSKKKVNTLKANYIPTHLSFLPNGDMVSAEVDEERGLRLKIWDQTTAQIKKDESFDYPFRSLFDLKILEDHHIIAIGYKEYEKRMGEYVLEKFLLRWNGRDKPHFIYDNSHCDHTTIAVFSFNRFVTGSQNGVAIWNGQTPQIIHQQKYISTINSTLAVDSKKNIIYSFGNKLIRLLDLQGKVVTTLKGHEENIQHIGVMSNDDIVSSDSKTIRIWSGSNYQCKKILYTNGPITSLVMTPDGQLITGHEDGRLEIYEFEMPKPEVDRTMNFWNPIGKL